VIIAPVVLARVVAHARETAPRECCGLLLGAAAHIVDVVPTRNIADDPGRFEIDPADHIAGRRDARRRGLEVVGFYHSHPHSAPEPSARDLAEASYPDHLYLIVGLGVEPPESRLFRLVEGNFREVVLVHSAECPGS
jgi:proteasome lid subunit RPN8/RPN11